MKLSRGKAKASGNTQLPLDFSGSRVCSKSSKAEVVSLSSVRKKRTDNADSEALNRILGYAKNLKW